MGASTDGRRPRGGRMGRGELRGGAGADRSSLAGLRMIDLELSRAALALDDLDRAPGRGRPESRWELVDVDELLVESVEAWCPVAAEQGVELQLAWPGACAELWAERVRLAQAVGNLISNAIEHGGG